ncbi:MAG TPA: ParM/StbA family protein [Armatimonadota bacterium]|nr:ParM/StbA family protein [Armatimonadota bacterium]
MPAKPKKHALTNAFLIQPLASFDLGNATAKIKTADVSTEFRSIAGRLSRNQRFGEITSPLVFGFEGDNLAFGDECRDLIDGEPIAYTDMRRYIDGFYRRLFAAALWRSFRHLATQGVLYPTIVCSIPVSEYADGKADEVKQNVVGSYVMDGLDGVSLYVTVIPENLIIIPEGAGSYFQALYTPGSNLASREVAIVDIGFYTTDLVVFNKGNYVAGSARSSKHGVQQVAAGVYQYLRQQYRYEGDVWTVDNELAAGAINIGNRCFDFTEQRDGAYCDLLDDILTFYRSSKGSRTPSAVVLSGGGAEGVYKFLPEDLKDEGWRVATNPRRANAEGAYLFLEQRQQAKGDNGG